MGLFRQKRKEELGLDWEILQHSAIALYWNCDVLAEAIQWFASAGYRIDVFDCLTWISDMEVYRDFKRMLGLPDYCGETLTSLLDCLGELQLPESGRRVLVFNRFDAFAKGPAKPLAQPLLEVIESTSRQFLLKGCRFLALAQSNDPRITFERVGARPVNWNPREWLEKDRGLRGAT